MRFCEKFRKIATFSRESRRSLLTYLALSVATFCVFIAPGVFFSFIEPTYKFRFDLHFLAAFVPAALIFPLVRPRIFAFIVLGIFALMELVQFSHLFWFKAPLSVFSLALIGGEASEIAETVLDELPRGWFILAFIVLVYGALIYAYARFGRTKSFIATALIVIMLGILPYKAMFRTPELGNFLPRNDAVSLYNDMLVFNAYFFIYLRNNAKREIPAFPPYEVRQISHIDNNRNIVIVLGESVNANHIGILGYERDTTPRLSQLAQSDSNFIAKKAISSSVLTRISLQMLFNLTYHPRDILHTTNQPTHLLKLAKEAGFKTYYISNQTSVEVAAMAGNYIDVITTSEYYPLESERMGDLVLLSEMKKYDFSKGKNFIIFHQRSAHSPYESAYRSLETAKVYPLNVPSDEQKRINSYDNALIFNDYIISQIFAYFRDLRGIPNYMFFIPDHGEAMGEIGKNGNKEFGHTILSENVANIPLFASLYNGENPAFINALKESFYPTHYELGLIIAELLGFEVKNPQFENNTFYINGIQIDGSARHITIHKDAQKREISFEYDF